MKRISVVLVVILFCTSFLSAYAQDKECETYSNQFKIDFVDQTNVTGEYDIFTGVQNGHNTEALDDIYGKLTLYDSEVNNDGEVTGFYWELVGFGVYETVIKFGTNLSGTIYGVQKTIGFVSSQNDKAISHFTICIGEPIINGTIPTDTPTMTSTPTFTPRTSSVSTIIPTETPVGKPTGIFDADAPTIIPTYVATKTPTIVATPTITRTSTPIIYIINTPTSVPTNLEEMSEPPAREFKNFLPSIWNR